jgi:outer membrane lipoprotein-sorting protein
MVRSLCPVVLIAFFLTVTTALTAPAPEPDREVKEIIAKAIQARGGAANIEKYKACTYKFAGTLDEPDVQATVSGLCQEMAPDKEYQKATINYSGQEITFIHVSNGAKAWESVNGNTAELDKENLESSRESHYTEQISSLRGLNTPGLILSPLGESKVDGKPVIGVRVTCKEHRDVKLYFDKQKGLLIKREVRTKEPMTRKEYDEVQLYSDFKNVSGLMIPFKIAVNHDGSQYFTFEISDVTLSEKLPDNVFVKP